MSSDVQGPGDSNELSKRELEDLKETSDETEMVKLETGSALSVVLVEDISNPDIFFIPFNFTLAINPRHSYPPTKDFLPFQHIIRSFSDSHLCLKLNANSPLLTAPMNPSVLFVDLVDKNNPLRRSKATNSLLSKEEEILQELEETQSSAGSWCSGAAEGCWWDTEYIQHCVRLDDVRLKPQKDILHLDYDNTELEDWSLSLSCEDIAKGEASTPGTLPCAQDAEVAHLTVDTKESTEMTSWNSAQSMESPGGSWSSGTSNNSDYCCHSLNEACFNECSKRSSVASDDAESSLVGTDFTRDFYRLVKFESTKSLASNSSRSIANGDVGIRDSQSQEPALRNVLSFIAEQQQYCHSREEEDTVLQTCSTEQCKSDQCSDERKCKPDVAETTETESLNCSLQETSQTKCEEVADDTRTELYDNCTELPNIQENVTSFTVGSLMTISEEANDESAESPAREQPQSPRRHESLIPVPKPSPRTKPPQHRKSLPQKSRLAGTKIPVKSSSKKSESSSVPKTSEIKSPKASSARETNIPVPTAKKAEVSKKVKSPEVSKVVVADDGSFHERATSKDVIDELNRMIRKGEEVTPGSTDGDMKPLDVACCCPTGWVHVERDIDFTDPKVSSSL